MLRKTPIHLLALSPSTFRRFLLLIVLSLFGTVSAADERIVDAVKTGDLAAMNSLIAEGVDVDAEFKH